MKQTSDLKMNEIIACLALFFWIAFPACIMFQEKHGHLHRVGSFAGAGVLNTMLLVAALSFGGAGLFLWFLLNFLVIAGAILKYRQSSQFIEKGEENE